MLWYLSGHSTFYKHFLSELPLIHTSGKIEFHDHNTVHLPKDREYWQVTMSVTAKSEAYIVLCEGQNPFSSACYWIILGGWLTQRNGPRCVIRRCPQGVNTKLYPTEPCRTPVDSKDVSINTKCKLMCVEMLLFLHLEATNRNVAECVIDMLIETV